ncbi:hypothetical protein ONZ43_g6385 [Nemania bipapillata]|uniref:Uncharacterized protein n=1 Tax=Nemania bipapillata TaxID=110536 RepID=A0ACC2HZP8_9PEZI|nr:hypothetical protein ONZ43_g6385 [Nemania bipapillata]
MSTADDLLRQYQGHVVPRSFHSSFVILSFLVSFIGAVSTLEIINRRTSGTGFRNHVFLVSAAVTMGGISIWSMHFVGNRAIVLAQDQLELQIVYSAGFTALSFFLPIVVLLAAFIATGTNNDVSFWRICRGVTYVGNASITNYRCEYTLANAIGSAVIAVVASNVALSIFFLWRASWTNSWWRRGLCGVMLAGAVSGMHWCATTGTNYRLLRLAKSQQFSRNTIVMAFTVLSFSIALVVAGVIGHETWVARSNASKARHVALAAAIFDNAGRILVRPDGLLPSEKITDTYIEKTPNDMFSIENPLFQWMFQASRNWSDIGDIIPSMANHVAHLPRDDKGGSVRLISENGQLIEDYDIIFRELFCLAATSLAGRLKETLPNIGVLWDDILPTGKVKQHYPCEDQSDFCERGESASVRESPSGLGSLMFLVRRVENSSDVQKLEAAGFRFADVCQVSGIIRSGMHIETQNLSHTLSGMAKCAAQSTTIDPIVHMCFFGVRARLDRYGFDILVEKGVRNGLLASKLPLERLEPWHTEFLRPYDGLNVLSLQQQLAIVCSGQSPSEAVFASFLIDAIDALRARVDDGIIDAATFSCQTVQVPCRPRPGSGGMEDCTVMVLHFIIPIHYSLQGAGCEFVPLNFFKLQQMMYKDSPYQAAFIQHLYRELIPAIREMPTAAQKPTHQRGLHRCIQRLTLGLGSYKRSVLRLVDEEGGYFPAGRRRGLSRGSLDRVSVTAPKLWGLGMDMSSLDIFTDMPHKNSIDTDQGKRYVSSLGGILVSQEIKVAVSQAEDEKTDKTTGQTSQDQQQSCNPSLLFYQQSLTLFPERDGHAKVDMDGDGKSELQLATRTADTSGQVEQALVSTMVAGGTDDKVVTFVDELLSLCVEFR